MCGCVLVAQSCPTLCDPMYCSPPGFSTHGILQARILEWVGIPFSKGSSWPRNRTKVSGIAGGFFTNWAIRETKNLTLVVCFLLSLSESFQLLSRVRLFETRWTAAHQASLSITNSQSLLKLMYIESVIPSNHLILCCPLLLPLSIFHRNVFHRFLFQFLFSVFTEK